MRKASLNVRTWGISDCYQADESEASKTKQKVVPASGLSGSVGSMEKFIAPVVGVSNSKSYEDSGEGGRTREAEACE